jgi:hypothetical protein
MIVRVASDNDLPAIVDLLKLSLGEGLMPKSEKYWRWKHLENPFGQSPVLLAEEGGVIIGVRAFMQWKWTDGQNVFNALRAVDTATHPQHQGKGIFKKLTLQLIQSSSEMDFIFNTPNKQSKPGYLKMGWEEAGRLPLNIKIVNPFRPLIRALRRDSTVAYEQTSSLADALTHPNLEDLLVNRATVPGKIKTMYSRSYLQWRYANVPVAKYEAVTVEQQGILRAMLIYRPKMSALGQELRVTDVFTRSHDDTVLLRRQLWQRIQDSKVDYIASSGTSSRQSVFSQSVVSRFVKGPAVTVRKVKTDVNVLIGFGQWHPSLGDLELF